MKRRVPANPEKAGRLEEPFSRSRCASRRRRENSELAARKLLMTMLCGKLTGKMRNV
ncbi:MAG: hypothetical protein FWE92_00125 [Defluviitaleaceae bacterium]|nr:hypothetical protein [Defluviitaleaceae bacterium]